MAKMRAIDAAVRILEKEGVSIAFGVPGAAINPLYSALKKRGSIGHILARHVEGASHMAAMRTVIIDRLILLQQFDAATDPLTHQGAPPGVSDGAKREG